ncbi:MAG: ankyrin repeat domain-containing protein [Akkermansia sp.]|nr:ankyrin repeat domain-containing protein [Akkermansia sp.]
MKDFANPLLLLIIIILLSWKISTGMETPASVEVWLLTLCATGFAVNLLLCVAKLFSKRKSLMSFVWCTVHIIFFSCAWVVLRQEKDFRDEVKAYNALNSRWEQEKADPYQLRDEEGRSLLELAAILGKKMVVKKLISLPQATQSEEIIMRAAVAAAENGRHELLTLLAKSNQGIDFNKVIDGKTLLISAVLSDNRTCAKVLLDLKANPDICDENGVSPLMHAVIDDNRSMVRLLMDYGADPYLKDHTGRHAASCSRSELMDELLRTRDK